MTRRLIDVDGYTFRVFVTNRQGDGAEIWRDYNERACCKQYIEALKNDLQADGFCMKDFWLSVMFVRDFTGLGSFREGETLPVSLKIAGIDED